MNALTEKDKNKIIDVYFYLQDASIEISSCASLIVMANSFLKHKEYREYIEQTGQVAILYPFEGTPMAFTTMARVALHNLIINIFKICELIQNRQEVLKNIPETNKKLNEFKKKYFTNDLKNYRNKYVAHHLDEKEKWLVPLSKLKDTLARILGLQNFDEEFEISSLVSFAQNFHLNDQEKNTNTITGIIHQSSKEIQKLGITLKRIQ